ncbi:sulfonate ABC transporter permease [Kyrpidia spormannii]|uniref:Sulfonate ABC transporter permease n=2 Tax=Kyrpidia spormannii TaxID=2055160 RepID=A0A2K8N618_9BACL|nr:MULTISPECIES: ABC transporter permease subunit [Kyrpidia]ATY84743.1 sulfonate ABC transporter permease [Kyrpidia spormannii]MCL6575498.1 ABC transporter permease subunit [Kyrpidia sp.]CAB3391834.1 Sulfonate ABC transporter permease [Kyrpidia spormannii]CAB3392751.1 Sulfonate ABC transporter permease [Kyrpidia spormannii]
MPAYGQVRKKTAWWVDAALLAGVLGLLYGIVQVGKGMVEPYAPQSMTVSLDPAALPYYAGRSLMRMFLALGASVVFTVLYARLASRSRLGERILIPLLDILQSVPVLGFLSVTVVGFMALFPGSLLGPELASIFAIFTGQVWNMTFGFYQSITGVPKELREASRLYGLGGIRRFFVLDFAYGAVPLVWNSMMSFGGGWFFLAVSESITVLHRDIRLPGIGSYMAAAMDEGDVRALLYAMVTMVIVIIVVDQLFWRPLVAWTQRFKVEQTAGLDLPTSWMLTLLRRSHIAEWARRVFFEPAWSWMIAGRPPRAPRIRKPSVAKKVVSAMIWAAVFVVVVYWIIRGGLMLRELGWRELLSPVLYGVLTLLRVAAAVLLGALWTIPVGVWIGTHPKWSRVAQPAVLVAASFPANMFFPLITAAFLSLHVSLEWGSVVLMMLGTQWYILFNVIAGASAIPGDLREASDLMRLGGWRRWRLLILPVIFPSLVTGLVTAAGGAWNASIVAEVVSWKGTQLAATGLGAYITRATTNGDWPAIVWGIVVMAAFVVAVNRLLWRRLYRLAENRYRLEV